MINLADSAQSSESHVTPVKLGQQLHASIIVTSITIIVITISLIITIVITIIFPTITSINSSNIIFFNAVPIQYIYVNVNLIIYSFSLLSKTSFSFLRGLHFNWRQSGGGGQRRGALCYTGSALVATI